MCTWRKPTLLLVLVLVGSCTLPPYCERLIAAEAGDAAEGSPEWVNSAFQKGKTAYYGGDYKTALSEWDALTPYLNAPQNASVRRMVEFLKGRIKEQLPTDAPSAETVPAKAAAPAGMKDTLSRAADRLESETASLEAARRAAAETQSQRQALVDSTFQKGKALYDEGRVPEAVSLWKTIAPLVENGDSLKSALDNLDKKYREAAQAKQRAEASAAADTGDKPVAPRELMSALNSANEKMRQDTLAAQAKLAESDQQVSRQQVQILQTFQRGEDLYDQGRYDEAMKEWDSISPALRGQDEAEQLFEALKENYRAAIEAKQNAENAAAGRQVKFKAPPEFLTLLNQADQKLKAEAEDAEARKNDSEALTAEKQQQLQALYEKGKFLFEDGQFKEALDVWRSMAPNYTDEVQIKSSLKFIDSNYQKWLEAQESAKKATVQKSAKVATPSDFQIVLDNAARRIEEQARKADTDRAAAQRSIAERQAWVNATYQKGRTLYDAGRMDEALSTWETLLPYVDSEGAIAAQINSLRRNSQHADAEKKAAADLAAKAQQKTETPDEFVRLLTQATQELDSAADRARNDREKMEKTITDRQAWVRSTFDAGKLAYQKGDVDEAILQWERLEPYLDDTQGIKDLIARVKESAAKTAEAQRQAGSFASGEYKNLKLPFADEMNGFLNDTDRDLRAQTERAIADRRQLEKDAADRQAWITDTFQKGKTEYQSGNIRQALETWDTVTPYLRDGSRVKVFIEQIRQNSAAAEDAKAEAEKAMRQKDMKFESPEGLATLLDSVSQKYLEEKQTAMTRQADSEKSVDDRKAWLITTFAKGKAAFQAGQTKEAFNIWKEMTPYLENETEIRRMMDQLEEGARAAEAAKRSAEEAAAKKESRLPAPAELSAILDQAADKFESEARVAADQKARAEQTAAERQAWIRSKFESGKSLYDAGQFKEALDIWKEITPYVEESSGVAQAMAAAQSAYQSNLESKAALEAAAAQSATKLQASDELTQLLSNLKGKLDADTQMAESDSQKASQSFTDRQRLVNDSFEKGKALYEKGQYAEAIQYWEAMLPHVEKSGDIRETLNNLKDAYGQLSSARSEAESAAAKSKVLLEPPAQLAGMLNTVDQKLQDQTREAAAQKAHSEKSFAERQAAVNETYQKGLALYKEGKFAEAVAEWQKLSNYFDASSGVPQLMKSVGADYEQAQAAQRAAVEAAANEVKLIKAPADLGKVINAAGEKLVAETQAARAREARSKQSLSDRQAWLDTTFAKAVDLEKQGNYEGSLKLWAEMLPYLKENPEAQQAIFTLKQNYDAFVEAKNSAEEAASDLHQKPQVPGDLVLTLTEANERLKNDTAIASQRTVDARKSNEERKAYLDDTLRKARALYEGGKVREALDTWKTALPYFEETNELKGALNAVEISLGNANDAKAARDEALAKEKEKFKASDNFRALINQAKRSMDDETKAALSEKGKAEMNVEERRKWVANTVAQGQALAEQGRMADAIDAWDSVTPQLEGEEAWKKIIGQLRQNYEAAQKAQEDAKLAAQNAQAKLGAPEGFEKQLGLAQQQLDFSVQDAQARKQKMEKDIADRKAIVLDLFQKGSALFQKHQYPEAFAEWDKMMPYLDKDQGVLQLLDKVKQTYEKSEESWKRTNEFAQHEYRDLRVPFSGEMKNMLQDVDQKLELQIHDADAKRAEMEKAFADRKQWINDNFAKGKDQLSKGQYTEGLETWNTILPYLDDDTKVRESMAAFEASRQKFQAAQNARADAESRKDLKFKAPEDMFKMLDSASESLKNQSFESKNQVAQIDKANADREKEMFAQFQRGRTLYEQGKYTEAVETWNGLSPYLEDKTALEAAIQNFKENNRNALEAQTQAQAAAQRKDMKMRAPEELLAMLARASQNLESDANTHRSEAVLMEKANADRQQFVLSNFQKGKELYDAGKFKEATETWNQILPYLDDEATLRDSVKNVEQTYDSLMEAKQQAASATVQQDMKFETPEELPKLLVDVQQRFKLDGMKALGESAQAEKTRAEREEWLRATFMKGKQLFQDGRTAEAIEAWRAMTTYLQNPQKVEQLLNELDQSALTTAQAKKAAEEAAAKTQKKFETPPDLVQYLRQADESLKNETFVAQNQRSRTDQSFSDKQQFINQTYMAGKSYYEEGKYGQAVSEWSKLGPYLDEASGLPKLLEGVKKSYEASLEAKRAAVEAAAGEYKGLQLSYKDQMSKLLDEANAKLIKETAESRNKQSQTEQTLAERKEWAVTTFNKGKILYDQARYDEALEQWERLVPFLGEDSFLAKQIETMRKNYNVSIEAKQASEAITQGKPVPTEFKEGSQLSLELEQMSLKLKDEADKYRDKAAQHDKSIAERKEWMSFVYKKGKDQYEKGDYDGALAQWELLAPYLGEQPDLARMVDRAKSMATEKKNAKEMAESSKGKAESLTPLPPTAATEIASIPPMASAAPRSEPQMPTMPSTGSLPLNIPSKAAEPAAAPAASAEGDSIQFVSGEVTSVDDLQKTITLKPYTAGKSQTVTINFDEGTQVSSTESNQSIASLQRGAAIDIRYDMRTSRAVYVYIY